MDIASFSMQKFIVFLLVLVRTGGIFTLTPVFGASQSPKLCRVGIALAMTMVFVPIVKVSGVLATDMVSLSVMIFHEACIGLIIGFVASLIFMTIQIAGQFVDFQSGLAFASMVDPVNGVNSGIMGRFQNMLAILLFLATNAHHLVIRGLADSFLIAPIGGMSLNPAVATGILQLFTTLFSVAVRISLPVAGAVFIADVALAIMARIVPQVNIIIVGMPLKLGIAVAAMMIALPLLVMTSQGMYGDMYHQMGVTIRQLTTF